MSLHDIGLDPQEGDAAEKSQMVCGTAIDGAAVGQPGEVVKCRSTDFEIRFMGADGRPGVMSVCPVCRAQDDLRLYRTTQRGTHPQHPHLCLCGCGSFRFRLYDTGNAIETRCANCGTPEELGTARSLGV